MSCGCEYVFTFGATQSNHAMQTATACRRCGLKAGAVSGCHCEAGRGRFKGQSASGPHPDVEVLSWRFWRERRRRKRKNAQLFWRGNTWPVWNKEAGRCICYEVPMGEPVRWGLWTIEGYVELEKQLSAGGASGLITSSMPPETGGTMAGWPRTKSCSVQGLRLSPSMSARKIRVSKTDGRTANESLKLIGAGITVEAERISIPI